MSLAIPGNATGGPRSSIRRVCVYCGSRPGNDPAYAEAARRLGSGLADAGMGLVYGGGTEGLMGIVARAVLDNGGHVTGIIPTFLAARVEMLRGTQDLIVVDDMHARKLMMFDKADAFVALPGGIGTLEELVEQMTWLKLDRHCKPVVIADIADFWSPLLRLLDHMDRHGFTRGAAPCWYHVCRSPDEILSALRTGFAHGSLRVESRLPQARGPDFATIQLDAADSGVNAADPIRRHDIYEVVSDFDPVPTR